MGRGIRDVRRGTWGVGHLTLPLWEVQGHHSPRRLEGREEWKGWEAEKQEGGKEGQGK